VRFKAVAESAQHNPVINVAGMHYEYTPVEGGIPANHDVVSNEVSLEILKGDINVTLLMSKIAVGAAQAAGEFEFGIFEQGGITPLYTATNDNEGLITFSGINFTADGEYHYIVKEIDAPDDWETDDSEWPICIVVTNVQGNLVATVEYPNGVPTFVNKLRGATCGAFQFPDLTYSEPGIYKYAIKELTPSGDGWTTDDRVIRLIASVVDDGHGNLIATLKYPDGFPSFTNVYKLEPARIVISGCKIAIGAPLPAGRFEFGLFDSERNLIAKVTNGAADETVPDDA